MRVRVGRSVARSQKQTPAVATFVDPPADGIQATSGRWHWAQVGRTAGTLHRFSMSHVRRRIPGAHGHGFVFGLGMPALFVPRLPSTPPVTPVTSENLTEPAGGVLGSATDVSVKPQNLAASAFEPGGWV